MKNFLVLFIIIISKFCLAESGIYESYVVIENNTVNYYDCNANTNNPDFESNLGTFSSSDNLTLKGGEIKSWKNNGSDVTGAYLYYRVYKEGETPGSFQEISLGFNSNLEGNNQKWSSINKNTSLIPTSKTGNYTLEIYFKISTNEGDKLDNNNSQNYKASFTISDNKELSLNNGTVIISRDKPDRNSAFTITLKTKGTPLENADKVYLHAGIGTDKPNSHSFAYTVGNWGKDDNIGKMTSIGNNLWQIEINSINQYFNIPINEDTFSLNFLFRNAEGNKKEDFGNKNYHVELEPGSYFLIDTPTLPTKLVEVNQSFQIKATANTATHWKLIEINENGNQIQEINIQDGEIFSFSHSIINEDIHQYKLFADFGGTTKYKTFKVKGYTSPKNISKPAGAKDGANYNLPNDGDITLVLHTPTSTTYNYYDTNNCSGTKSTRTTPAKKIVYLLGDFNDWQMNEDYKMNIDGDYWWITLKPNTNYDPNISEYIYQYFIDGEIRIADPYATKVSDPNDRYISDNVYPNLIEYPFGKTTEIASVLEINKVDYDWQIKNFERKYERNELNIYELHFRDFTEEGTYKAATKKLDYLKNLGINTIHVMPISEFEGNDSWGYNPNYYFAADKAYGTANDLKEFIDEAHKRDIAVINDLVLNHAFESNPNVRMYWDKDNHRPATYNPWFNAEHKSISSPGGHWGADWNHASEHTQKMVDDILKYWITEFKFDGFRFDFTKGFSQKEPDPSDEWASNYDQCRIEILKRMVDNMWKIDDSPIEHYAIFEHLANDREDKALADYGITLWSGAGPQNDWVAMAEGNDIRGFEKSWYRNRNFNNANFISYMESHDEERVGFKVKNYGKNNDGTTSYLSNRLKLVAAFNLLMPGPRMVWQFGELGYDISIDENGRTGHKPSAWELNYNDDDQRKEIYNLYSLIFKFRNKYDLYSNFDMRNNINNTSDWARTMSAYDENNEIQVISIGNFDTENTKNVKPKYYKTGIWFKYNGDPDIDGTPYVVNNNDDDFILFKNDPVYVLSNSDIIPPVFNVDPVTIHTDYCQYKLEPQYIITKDDWSNGSTTKGHVADNSGELTLSLLKINNEDATGIDINEFTPLNGENLIEWEATDGSKNVTKFTQSITIERGKCYKSGATGKSLPSDILISSLDRTNSDTTKRNGILVLESKTKGLTLTKVIKGEDINKITKPIEGMILYDENDECIKLYNGSSWSCIKQKALPQNIK